MKRDAPCTPSSDHSSVCSGGEANIVKSRAVSAPKRLTSPSGSTPLFSDFDILPSPWYSTRIVSPPGSVVSNTSAPAASRCARTSAGLK